MSAPTKCDKCGTTGTFAISVPCAMQCGGTMHFDAVALSGVAPEPSEALTVVTADDVRAVRQFIRKSGGLPDNDTEDAAAIFLTRRLNDGRAAGRGSGESDTP